MTNSLDFPFVDGSSVIAIGTALPAICVLIVALRFYTRWTQGQAIKSDDWLVLAALVLVISMGACFVVGACLKVMGYPTPPPPPGESNLTYLQPAVKKNQIIEFVFNILLTIAYGLIKLSIIFFYKRIFVTYKGSPTDIGLVVAAVVIILWTVTFVFLDIFNCGGHVWAQWAARADQFRYCYVRNNAEYGFVNSDLILDVLIFAIPIPLVWRLNLPLKYKFAVIGIFLLGASAVGASIARLILYYRIVEAIEAGKLVDQNQSATVSLWWSLLEAGLALIAACLPSISFLITHRHECAYWISLSSRFSRHGSEASNRSHSSKSNPSTVHQTFSTDDLERGETK